MSNRYSSVKGLSDNLRMPRLGKIRLGVKVANDAQNSYYPRETQHFVCPPEVEAIYGEDPTELDIVFPLDNEQECFPQAYKWYAGPSLRCKGDGESALRAAGALGDQIELVKDHIPADPNAMVEISCPCPLLDKDGKGKSACNLVGTLSFMLPRVSIAGIYQIDMRSYNSILNINSGLALARSIAGRISMIPFKLKRIPQAIQYKGKTNTHYILRLEHQLTMAQVQGIRGDKFFLGYAPQNQDLKTAGAAPSSAEDINPETLSDQKIEISVTDVQFPENGGNGSYIIKGCENAASSELEFKSLVPDFAKAAWEISTEDQCRVVVRYRIVADGSFEVFEILKGRPLQ